VSRNARVGSIPIPSTIQASKKAFLREGFFYARIPKPIPKGHNLSFNYVPSRIISVLI